MSDLKSLIERCEKATGPSRPLDADLCELFDLPECVPPDGLPDVYRVIIERARTGVFGCNDPDVPFYTSSLDAALALVERKLPGCEWSVSNRYFNGDLGARGSVKSGRTTFEHITPNATPALALCLALLRALDAAKATEARRAETEGLGAEHDGAVRVSAFAKKE